jgi:hypothetical protein
MGKEIGQLSGLRKVEKKLKITFSTAHHLKTPRMQMGDGGVTVTSSFFSDHKLVFVCRQDKCAFGSFGDVDH